MLDDRQEGNTPCEERPGGDAPADVAPLRYTVRFPEPHTHYAEVTVEIPAEGRTDVELMMAVWTPGSYMLREYSRHVEGLSAASAVNDSPLPVTKVSKNRWRVAAGGAKLVRVRYRVYGREMSVRTNWIEQDYALLNGAPTFLTLADGRRRRHEVRVEPGRGWNTVATGLARREERGAVLLTAADFDELIDSPIFLGRPDVRVFEVEGKRHELVTYGAFKLWDLERAARELRSIVEAQRRFWGSLPYERYVFMNLLTESYGGLEHRNSSVLMISRWAMRGRDDYLGWLALASHEFFHTWNVKRLRPVELGPFDYEREAFTRSLWVAEGITSYYDDLFVHRAGASSRDEYLKALSKNIERLQTTHGRKLSALDESSYDAWIKLYRADENTGNTSISYYIKGAVVAFLLDVKIRKATGGARSLDDLMRAAAARYAGACGYTEAQFRALASEVAGVDLGPWLDEVISGTDELGYDEALAWLGLRFKPSEPKKPIEGPAARDPWAGAEPAWLGVEVRVDNGRTVVSKVPRDTPGYAAGINVDDELVAIDDFRVRGGELDARLKRYRPGDTVRLVVARRDRLRTLDVTFRRKPEQRWELEVDPNATAEQVARRDAWLAGGTAPQVARQSAE